MKKETKCDKCKEVEATVHFTVVSGKFSSSKKRYCKKCAGEERIKMTPPVNQQSSSERTDSGLSLLGMVQKEMSREDPTRKSRKSPVAILTDAMAAAVAKEDYEKAANIRDEIAALQGKDAKKGDNKPGTKPSGTVSP